jgi:hypothetical protein
MPNVISERIITSPRVPRSRRVDVEVTDDVIDLSTQADSSHCMIADAVRKAVPGATGISVDLQTIRFSDPKKRMRYVYLTPRIAQLALVDFDAGKKPEPFRFRLDRAHITAMKSKNDPVLHPEKARMTPARTAAIQKARATRAQESSTVQERRNEVKRGERAAANAERLRGAAQLTDHGQAEHVPSVVGGSTPPIGALHSGSTGRKRSTAPSRRRQFGLRALERGSERLLRESGTGA